MSSNSSVKADRSTAVSPSAPYNGVVGGVPEWTIALRTSYARRTNCKTCHLELTSRDEMDAAGIGEPWYLEDVNERDFFGEYGDY
jgi:hypothetical protein